MEEHSGSEENGYTKDYSDNEQVEEDSDSRKRSRSEGISNDGNNTDNRRYDHNHHYGRYPKKRKFHRHIRQV